MTHLLSRLVLLVLISLALPACAGSSSSTANVDSTEPGLTTSANPDNPASPPVTMSGYVEASATSHPK
jgi:hypothetical protein